MTVMMYALSTCAWCRRAKKFLTENNIEFDFVDVDLLAPDERREKKAELKTYNSAGSFPTIVINNGEKVVVGFNTDRLKEALGL